MYVCMYKCMYFKSINFQTGNSKRNIFVFLINLSSRLKTTLSSDGTGIKKTILEELQSKVLKNKTIIKFSLKILFSYMYIKNRYDQKIYTKLILNSIIIKM